MAGRLHPHRSPLVATGLAAFLLGASPLLASARAGLAPAPWHVVVFAASLPVVLWALGLAALASFFDPLRGLVGRANPEWCSQAPWLRKLLHGYAVTTVAAFALAPLIVLLAAVY
jgi:hypothetical protein